MKRRLMFLHYLLNESEESLIFKVLKAQMKYPTKNDWINSVETDLKYLDIYLSFDDIQALSKQQFKTFLHVTIQEKTLKYLNNLKNNHSKVSHIQHLVLDTQEYLLPEYIEDVQLAKFILQARMRMLDLRVNFKQKYSRSGLNCELGCNLEETQEHILLCEKLEDKSLSNKKLAVYEDLFSIHVEDQLISGALLMERMKRRKALMK